MEVSNQKLQNMFKIKLPFRSPDISMLSKSYLRLEIYPLSLHSLNQATAEKSIRFIRN